MITKERLEELLKEKAKVYFIYNESFIAGYSTIAKIKELDLSNFKPIYFTSSNIKNDFMAIKSASLTVDRNDFENLFETEEDARWELEMTATRTETLKLANYTDFENENGDRVFYHKGTTYELSLWWASDNTKIIRVTWRCDDDFGWFFEKPLTKENYIEACKLCLRLFKGEEV